MCELGYPHRKQKENRTQRTSSLYNSPSTICIYPKFEVLATALTERLGYERCGFEVRVRPWVAILFIFDRNAFNNRSKISKCLKMAATVYQRDSCIGASVFWSCSLKWHGRFETAVVGKLPILFLKIFFFLLFAETPLIETSFALYGDVPRIKCRNV